MKRGTGKKIILLAVLLAIVGGIVYAFRAFRVLVKQERAAGHGGRDRVRRHGLSGESHPDETGEKL